MFDAQNLRDKLVESIDRWTSEVEAELLRDSLCVGIAQRCYVQIDRILELCVEESIRACGSEGDEAAEIVRNGKPLSLLTFGQRVKTLEILDSCLARYTQPLMPTPRAKVMGKGELGLLNRLTKDRNRHAHAFALLSQTDLLRLLTMARSFCESKLVQTIIALQRRGSQSSTEGQSNL